MRFFKSVNAIRAYIKECEKSVVKASNQCYEVKIKILLTSISQQKTQAKPWCFQTAW